MNNLICKKCNIRDCECVPYDIECDSCIRAYEQGKRDMQDFVEKRCKELGIDYIQIFTCEVGK